MSLIENEENTIGTCDFCHENTIDYYKFSCNHKVCILCLYRRIFCNYLKDLQREDEIITINCKKNDGGKLGKNLEEIEGILQKKLELDKEKEKAQEKFMFSNPIPNCKIHTNKKVDQYCLECSKSMCSECGNKHIEKEQYKNHRIISSKKLSNRIKRNISELPLKIPNKMVFENKFELMTNKLQESLEKDYNETLKIISDLANSLYYFKREYEDLYKKELTRCVKSLKILKLLYYNYYYDKESCKNSIDVNLLRFVNNISLEFMDLQINHNKSIDIKLVDMKSKLENLSKETKILNINYAFDDVPRSFKSEDILLKAHSEVIKAIIETPDQKIITGGYDYSIKVWEEDDNGFHNINTNNQLCGRVQCLLLLNNNRILSSSTLDNNIKVWIYDKAGNLNLTQSLTAHHKPVSSIIKLKDDRIATSSTDCTIKIWKEISNEFMVQQTFDNKDNKPIFKIICLYDNRIAYINTNDSIVNIINEKDEEYIYCTFVKRTTAKILTLCEIYNNDIHYIVTGGEDNHIYIYKPKDEFFEHSQTLRGHQSFINVVLQLKDGRFASASRDRTIRIWKYIPEDNIFKEDEVLSDYGHGMYALIQLDDGRLCSATSDNALVIWRNRMEEY